MTSKTAPPHYLLILNPHPIAGCKVILFNEPCWVACDDTKRGKALSHNRVGADDAIFTQLKMAFGAEYDSIVSKPGVLSDLDPTAAGNALPVNGNSHI